MITRLFVYGTLMQGNPNHRVLVSIDAHRLGEAWTRAPRTLVDLGPYPALLAEVGEGATYVAGELYEIDEAALAPLDAFEGCPDLYARVRIELEWEGAVVEAWTYVLARPAPHDAVVVSGGRYLGGGVVLKVDAREVDVLDKRR